MPGIGQVATTLGVAVAGIGIGVALARLALDGILTLAFRRVRASVRRRLERRRAVRDDPDRRQADRRLAGAATR